MVNHLDGKEYPRTLAERVERRDAVELVRYLNNAGSGAPGHHNATAPATAFMARAVGAYVSSMSDEDLARVLRDVVVPRSAGRPLCAECQPYTGEGA